MRKCFEAGAPATGAELEIADVGRDYADLVQDHGLGRAYRRAAAALGRDVDLPGFDGDKGGSTDMGNVSHFVPTIHPMIGYACGEAIRHNPELTRFGTTPGADKAVLDGGLAMAWTAVAVASDEAARERLLAALSSREARPTGR